MLWVATLWFAREGWWPFMLASGVATAGFVVRTFILFHDAGHGSFFPSRRANEVFGFWAGVLTFTPSRLWWHGHAIHHGSAGDLDRRGIGDVPTLTVQEYRALPWWRKLGYRVLRSPWILFTVGSLYLFGVSYRFWSREDGPRERRSVVLTNLALLGWAALWIGLFGWKAYLVTQLLVLSVAASAGVWLFYVQHNFPGTYWEHHEGWSFERAALEGSSYYKLPAWLDWITGHIGYHHVHHLNSRIPNYNLVRCYREVKELHVQPMTLRDSLACLRVRLWDEESGQMVGWEALRSRGS